MTYRVTHVDHSKRRRQVVLVCEGRRSAEQLAVLMFGAAFYLSAICLRRVVAL